MPTLLEALNLTVGQKIILETSSLPGGAISLQGVASPEPDLLLGVTALTTVGAGTITAAAMLSGGVNRTGPTSAFTDTTDTAAAIQGDWTGGAVSNSFDLTYITKTAFNATLAGGSCVTLVGSVIVPANSTAVYRVIWTGTSTLSMTELSVVSNTSLPNALVTALNATTGSLPVGAITGAKEVYLVSSNATPGAQLVRTAAQMLADTPNGAVGMSWKVRIINTGAGNFTLTQDAGNTVTITGDVVILQDSWIDYVVTLTGAATATMQSVGNSQEDSLPAAKYTSINATVGTLAAGNITGADRVFLVSTNATPGAQTTRTATQMFADTPNAKIGQTWTVRIQNTGAGTFTLTADASVTLGGTAHAAILTNTWVDYVCTFTSGTAMTMNAVGSGVSP